MAFKRGAAKAVEVVTGGGAGTCGLPKAPGFFLRFLTVFVGIWPLDYARPARRVSGVFGTTLACAALPGEAVCIGHGRMVHATATQGLFIGCRLHGETLRAMLAISIIRQEARQRSGFFPLSPTYQPEILKMSTAYHLTIF